MLAAAEPRRGLGAVAGRTAPPLHVRLLPPAPPPVLRADGMGRLLRSFATFLLAVADAAAAHKAASSPSERRAAVRSFLLAHAQLLFGPGAAAASSALNSGGAVVRPRRLLGPER